MLTMKSLLARFSLVLAIVSTCCSYRSARAQDTVRTVGIAASLQGVQSDILVPIWLSDHVVLAPSVGLLTASSISTDLAIGLNVRYYFSNHQFAPYTGLRFGELIALPENGSSVSDMIVGVMLGGEYYLHPRFALGVEAQLTFAKSAGSSNRFGNPGGTNVSTGTALLATYYF